MQTAAKAMESTPPLARPLHDPKDVVASPGGMSGPAKHSLQLLTFGLENCDSTLVDRCIDWGGGHKAYPSENELREALARQKWPDVDIILDARKFPNFVNLALTRHIGIHPEILSSIAQHRNFRSYLQDAKQQWTRALTARHQDSAELVVAVYCCSGKHRSVAVAESLAYIGKVVEGMEVKEVRHLSKPHWKTGCCKGNCQECSSASPKRESALQHAASLWGRAVG